MFVALILIDLPDELFTVGFQLNGIGARLYLYKCELPVICYEKAGCFAKFIPIFKSVKFCKALSQLNIDIP